MNAQLDPSWHAVLTYAHQHGLQFGRQVIFTYGPLGFAFVPDFTGYWVGGQLLLNFLVYYAVAAGACLLAWRMPVGWRWLTLGFLLVSPANILRGPDMTFDLGLVYWGLLCLTADKKSETAYALALAAMVAVLALVKFTLLVEGAVTLLVVAIERLWRGHNRSAWLMLLAATGMFLAGWRALGQKLTGLGDYLLNSLAVSSGFNQTMGRFTTSEIRTWGIAAAILALLAIIGRSLTATDQGQPLPPLRRWQLLGWLCLLAFINWKHGYVRTDDHVAIFLGFAALLTLSLEAVPSCSRWDRPVVRSASIAVCLLTCVALERSFPGSLNQSPSHVFARLSRNLRAVIHYSAYKREMTAALEKERQRDQLPRIRHLVGQEPVDVFGQNQAYAIFNDLNYHPRPVFQSYSAYTVPLMRLNEQYYNGPQAPDYVLLNLSPIDDRLGALEDARALRTVLTQYRPIEGEGMFLLLKRTTASAPTLTLVREGKAQPGEPIALSDFGGTGLWIEIVLQPTLLGRIEELFYQPSTPSLRLWWGPELRRSEKFRAPAAMLAAGFVASPLLRNNFDVVDVYAGNTNVQTAALSVEIGLRDRKYYREPFDFRVYRFDKRLGGPPERDLNRLKWPGFKSLPVEAVSPVHPVRLTMIDGEPAIFVHPGGHLKFALPPGADVIAGAYGFEEDAYTVGTTDGADFRVELQAEDGSTNLLYSHFLEPKTNPADRGLHAFAVPVPPGARGSVLLTVLPGPKNDTLWDNTCWAQIVIK